MFNRLWSVAGLAIALAASPGLAADSNCQMNDMGPPTTRATTGDLAQWMQHVFTTYHLYGYKLINPTDYNLPVIDNSVFWINEDGVFGTLGRFHGGIADLVPEKINRNYLLSKTMDESINSANQECQSAHGLASTTRTQIMDVEFAAVGTECGFRARRIAWQPTKSRSIIQGHHVGRV